MFFNYFVCNGRGVIPIPPSRHAFGPVQLLVGSLALTPRRAVSGFLFPYMIHSRRNSMNLQVGLLPFALRVSLGENFLVLRVQGGGDLPEIGTRGWLGEQAS